MKGEGGQFGAKGTEYDIIHVCRKRLEEPTPVSWPKMRQWVKAELKRLRQLLESYKARELSDGRHPRDPPRQGTGVLQPPLRPGVHGGKRTAVDPRCAAGHQPVARRRHRQPRERPPSIVQPVAYQFLRVFADKSAMRADDVGKSLRGTGITKREFELRGWTKEENKVVHCVPIQERFEAARLRPRKEMKTEIDQAHFLIGAALPGSGVNLEEELDKDTWMVRRSVEAVLHWYAKTAPDPEIRKAADRASFCSLAASSSAGREPPPNNSHCSTTWRMIFQHDLDIKLTV